MSYHIIETMEDIEQGVETLAKRCPLMRQAYEIAGLPPLRRAENTYKALARIITGQLLSVASASAIWGRLERLVDPFDAARLLALDDEMLRGVGLSGAKVKTLKALAAAMEAGSVDLAGYEQSEAKDVRASLVTVRGIGPWTADIYVMFCLGRVDGFASGDLALRNAAGLLQAGENRPTIGELEDLASTWQPWRGVAARLLWHYYAVVKNVKTNPLSREIK